MSISFLKIFNDMNKRKFSELMEKAARNNLWKTGFYKPPATTTKTKKNGSMQPVKKIT